MQSILQYRMIGKTLREQVKRHELDIAAGLCYPVPDSGQRSTDSTYESKDLEMGHAYIGDHVSRTNVESPESLLPQSQQRVQQGTATPNPDFQNPTRLNSTTTAMDTSSPELMTAMTQESAGTNLAEMITGVHVRTRSADMSHQAGSTNKHVFIVDYVDSRDPMNPHNWSTFKRTFATVLVALISLVVGFASSVDSAVIPQARMELHVSEVTESLATGLFLIGWGCGAFFAGPISETVGRNPVYVTTMILYMIFIMASGLSPNVGAQLAFRFLAGIFGSSPSTCAGGSISDMWTPIERTFAFPIFGNASFWGPILGPVLGGFIGEASTKGVISWRWTEWTTLIWSGLILALVVLLMPETYGPTLFKWKAAHLRQITRDERYRSLLEVRETKLVTRLSRNLYRPFVLFVREPIVILLTLYLSVVYIVLFTFLTGFEFIFTDEFQLSQGLTFLCFLGIGVGFLASTAMVPWVYKRYKAMIATIPGNQLDPEQRLIYVIIGAPCLPIGLFWMAWTSYSSLTLWPSLVATIPIGFAVMNVFISTYQYLIDVFEEQSASALVGATFARYAAAGAMIEVSIPMYRNLGVHWTLTVLGAISAVMAPVPFVFYKYGPAIRKRSRNATNFGVII